MAGLKTNLPYFKNDERRLDVADGSVRHARNSEFVTTDPVASYGRPESKM